MFNPVVCKPVGGVKACAGPDDCMIEISRVIFISFNMIVEELIAMCAVVIIDDITIRRIDGLQGEVFEYKSVSAV